MFLAPSEILPDVNLIRLSKFSKLAATSILAGAKSKMIFPTTNNPNTLTTLPIEDFKKSIISPNFWTLLIPFTKLSKATLA